MVPRATARSSSVSATISGLPPVAITIAIVNAKPLTPRRRLAYVNLCPRIRHCCQCRYCKVHVIWHLSVKARNVCSGHCRSLRMTRCWSSARRHGGTRVDAPRRTSPRTKQAFHKDVLARAQFAEDAHLVPCRSLPVASFRQVRIKVYTNACKSSVK